MLCPGARRTVSPGATRVLTPSMETTSGSSVSISVSLSAFHRRMQRIPPPPVDDVFRFQPMEMGGSNLSAADKHNLFTIGFVFLLQTSITEGYQRQADFQEIAPAEVGQVPTHGSFPDIITFRSFGLPVVRSPVRPWRAA